MASKRIVETSMGLPRYSPAFEGDQFYVSEIGSDQVATWVAMGGASQQWRALTPSHVGPVTEIAALDVTTMLPGAWVEIDQPISAVGTKPPTSAPSGTKMNRLRLQLVLSHDGVTKQWKPMGAQTLFEFSGNPVTAALTSTGADVACEFGLVPAGLLALLPNSKLYWSLKFGRGTGASTATAALAAGTVSGTVGSILGTAGFAANNSSVPWVFGEMDVLTATAQLATFSVSPGGAANVSSNVGQTLNLANNFILQAAVVNATAAQTFTLLAAEAGIR